LETTALKAFMRHLRLTVALDEAFAFRLLLRR